MKDGDDMVLLMFAGRIGILLIVIFGYLLLLKDRLQVTPMFGWIVVFSSIGCLVYLAGIASLLLQAVYGITAVGILLFIYYAIIGKLHLLFGAQSLRILNILFVIVFLYLGYSMYNTRYMHYDNFSHWGLVVKYMLAYDRIPDAAAKIIDFKTYPLGSSSFLYYVCRIAGSREDVMLLAQLALLFAGFYAMFGVIKDKKRFLLISIMALLCSSMTYFNIAIRTNNLLVDFLMPILGLAGIAILFAYRAETKKGILLSLPILAFLIAIKNSGVFFAAICFAYMMYLCVSAYNGNWKRKAGNLLLAAVVIGLSLAPMFIWSAHTKAEFPGELTKHTMSFENFESVFGEKTPEVVTTIITNYRNAVFNIRSLPTLGIVLYHVLAILSYSIARFGLRKRWHLLTVLIWIDVAAVIYFIGILAMFLFTMPEAEALILAGYERYASSMVMFMIGALAIVCVHDVESSFYIQQGAKRDYRAFKSLVTKTIYEYATTACIALTSIILLSEINGMNSMKEAYQTSLPGQVLALTGERWDQVSSKKYLFYASDADRQISDYYLQYIGKYYLFTPFVDATSAVKDHTAFIDKLQSYQFLVIVESNVELESFMRQEFGAKLDAGIYDVQELLQRRMP